MKKVKTILVPLDGSELATHIIPSVQMLATTFPVAIHLLTVISDEQRHVEALPWYPYDIPIVSDESEQHMFRGLREGAEAYLHQSAVLLQHNGLDVKTSVQFGNPVECIVQTAMELDVTFIAMVTHGYSGIRRWALGSVTDRVVHASNKPVFVVRNNPQIVVEQGYVPSLRRILVPLDGSAFSRQALSIAVELATCAQSQLRLVRAVFPIDSLAVSMGMFHVPTAHIESLLEKTHQDAEESLHAIAGELRQCHLQVSTCLEDAYPAELIVEEAARWQSDLIVMATHGYSGIQRWALGSVADKVLHATTTPLVLVHAHEDDATYG